MTAITADQEYLGARLWVEHEDPFFRVGHVVALNQRFGVQRIENAMRFVHGFPPPEPIRNLYGYLKSVARDLP